MSSACTQQVGLSQKEAASGARTEIPSGKNFETLRSLSSFRRFCADPSIRSGAVTVKRSDEEAGAWAYDLRPLFGEFVLRCSL